MGKIQASASRVTAAVSFSACFFFASPRPSTHNRRRDLLRMRQICLTPPAGNYSSPQSLDPQSAASISGIVLDVNDGLVPDAKIILETQNGQLERLTEADGSGLFSFNNLTAGTFKVRITAPGLQPFESNEIVLHAGERYQMSQIALAIAAASVTADRNRNPRGGRPGAGYRRDPPANLWNLSQLLYQLSLGRCATQA